MLRPAFSATLASVIPRSVLQRRTCAPTAGRRRCSVGHVCSPTTAIDICKLRRMVVSQQSLLDEGQLVKPIRRILHHGYRDHRCRQRRPLIGHRIRPGRSSRHVTSRDPEDARGRRRPPAPRATSNEAAAADPDVDRPRRPVRERRATSPRRSATPSPARSSSTSTNRCRSARTALTSTRDLECRGARRPCFRRAASSRRSTPCSPRTRPIRSSTGVQLDGFVAADDDAAQETVLELVESIGLRPVDVGPLAARVSSKAWRCSTSAATSPTAAAAVRQEAVGAPSVLPEAA